MFVREELYNSVYFSLILFTILSIIVSKTISDIYIDLYNTQKFTVEELNDIRVYNL